jgi:hypothetical protein
LSEKNNPVIVPWPSAQRATGVRVSAAPGGRGLSGSRGSMSTELLVMVVLIMVMSCSWKSVEVPVGVMIGVLMSRSVMSGAFWNGMGLGTEKRKRPPGWNPAAWR